MPMAGVLGNANAVLSHARGTIPVVKENFANLSDGSAPRRSRALSGVILAGVAVVVVALGYAIYQEWQIHIISATITAAEQARKTKADADAAEANASFECWKKGGCDNRKPSIEEKRREKEMEVFVKSLDPPKKPLYPPIIDGYELPTNVDPVDLPVPGSPAWDDFKTAHPELRRTPDEAKAIICSSAKSRHFFGEKYGCPEIR
jgi:hypothetical protein